MDLMPQPIIIAVDGPAASGKGTLSRRVAKLYGLRYLDSGKLYRGVGWAMLSQGLDPADEAKAEDTARTLDPEAVESPQLRSHEAGRAASIVAAFPGVRAQLLHFQRSFADEGRGAVLDGRDIGTVIFPDAPVKLFVTASPEERARRRFAELQDQDPSLTLDTVIGQIKRRDERDQNRQVSPMKPASDAHLLDTTSLDIDAAFAAACRVIDKALEEDPRFSIRT
ncbi:MAG: (d)CMP kinase [Pseudomonadota bacterium]